MAYRSLTLVLFFWLCLVSAAAAQEGINSFISRDSFTAAATELKVSDFEGIVPNSGFKQYKQEGSLVYAGAEFRPGGGARFGPGAVIVVGAWYNAGPIYETTSGAKLHWSPPNQPGNAYLDITLPSGTTAVGLDVWTAQPMQSTLVITATNADGKTRSETITTPARPAAGFIGFVSSSAITSLRITPPKGQTGLIVDNFTTGKARSGVSFDQPRGPERPIQADRAPITATFGSGNRPGETPRVLPAPNTNQTAPPIRGVLLDPSRRRQTSTADGVIAYVRGSTEIRLITPDGTLNKQLWTHPDLNEQLGIFELAWKPDGSELAFSSAHEASSSPYLADIYSIKRDGTDLRRITNPPERAGLAKFPKGSVTVNVANFQAESQTPGNFIVYVVGADEPQQIYLPAGSSKTVTFKSVADFGRLPQMVVAMSGMYRWFVPGVDVIAGRSVGAPMFPITGKGLEMHGAFRPNWRADGSRISFRSGLCLVSSTPAEPTPGKSAFDPLFAGKNPMGTCNWAWGPTADTADQVIYTENSAGSNIYQMTEHGAHPGTKLTQFSDLDYQLLMDLEWMPDASGILYSTVTLYRDASNIFRYDFATRQTTQVTRLEKEFAREFSASPDGRSIVFERCPTREEDKGCDLWTIGTDGTSARLLVRNGQRPAWGK